MTCLHMVSSLPGSQSFNRALASVQQGDTLLLCEDACYGSEFDCLAEVLIMAEDTAARGIASHFSAIEYPQLVELVCRHDKQIHWG